MTGTRVTRDRTTAHSVIIYVRRHEDDRELSLQFGARHVIGRSGFLRLRLWRLCRDACNRPAAETALLNKVLRVRFSTIGSKHYQAGRPLPGTITAELRFDGERQRQGW